MSTIKDTLKDVIDKLNLHGVEMSIEILDKYTKKETINTVDDDGKFCSQLLFPTWLYFYDCLNMCLEMQFDNNYRSSRVIEYWLMFLEQTDLGRERKILLQKVVSDNKTEIAVMLVISKMLNERKALLSA